ncbi:MAG: UbiD family decarboxylase [Pirellulales bacterium]
MTYRSLRECVDDLDQAGMLVRIEQEIDPRLEAAEIQRRVYAAGGPAVYFDRVKGCQFPLVSNLFGTMPRTRFLFRHSLAAVEQLVRYKADPGEALRRPLHAVKALRTAWHTRPKYVSRGPVLAHSTAISQLPQIVSWPDDAGAFILLPQVYTEDPGRPGFPRSNLGMYRVQLSGGQYQPNKQIGLHYQIHRGIGVHHAAAIRGGQPLKVNIFVGGPPAMTVAAVMPLPEGLPELAFAGALGGRRIRLARQPHSLPVHVDADFCISGSIVPNMLLPEGPFGDHLGYYSLAHDFPVMQVDKVWHRQGAIWPFTAVGRPPQEDTCFGQFIHELTGPVIPTVVPGVSAVNAVDAAGVHPLLLALGSERYVPYQPSPRPQELLTQANAILGQGQMSLAKYLLIAARQDNAALDLHDIAGFLRHMLERIDWQRDLHFQTATTIDTLDYSGGRLNEGSKVVMAAVGPRKRELPRVMPSHLPLPPGFDDPRICLPGVLAIRGPKHAGDAATGTASIERLCESLADAELGFPLLVVVDDSQFAAATLNNFLWVTFTRSNPAADIHGVRAFVEDKHWGCRDPLVIDARIKPHHAPPLVEDMAVSRRVDQLAAPGGPLHGIL